jgi:hypothetical protein
VALIVLRKDQAERKMFVPGKDEIDADRSLFIFERLKSEK